MPAVPAAPAPAASGFRSAFNRGQAWFGKRKDSVDKFINSSEVAGAGATSTKMSTTEMRTHLGLSGGAPRPATPAAPRPATPRPAAPAYTPALGTALTQEDVGRLNRVKEGRFKQVLNKVGTMTTDPREEYQPPTPTTPPAPSGIKAKAKAFGKRLYNRGKGKVEDGLEMVSSIGQMIELAKDGDFPFFGPIIGLISGAKDAFLTIKQVRAENKREDMTSKEKAETRKSAIITLTGVASDLLDLVQNATESIVGKAIDAFPIIGAAIGTAVNIADLAFNCIKLHKLVKRARKINDQRIIMEGSRGVHNQIGIARDKKTIVDVASGKYRAMRTDEALADLEAEAKGKLSNPDITEEEKKKVQLELAELKFAKERDMVMEIDSAGLNRSASLSDDIGKDIINIAASLAKFDVTGVGQGVGGSLNLGTGLYSMGRKFGSRGLQAAKNHGMFQRDLNKSKQNKLARRHRLAVTMFHSLRDVADAKLPDLNPADVKNEEERTAVFRKLNRHDVVKERFDAMDVSLAGIYLLEGTDSNGMVEILRQGFYRESQ